MEVVLIQVSFLNVGSKEKNKNENEHTEYHDILMTQTYAKLGIPIQSFTKTFLPTTDFSPKRFSFFRVCLF